MGNWKNRVLAAVLAACMLVALLPTVAFAAETVARGTCGSGLTWVLDDEGTLTISGNGSMNNYSTFYDNQAAPWYDYRDTIKTVVMEPGITYIGGCAFSDCGNLTSVTIPEGVTDIRYSAFYGCTSLTSVTLPDSLTYLGSTAFADCDSLESLNVPKKLTQIEDTAFINCDSLKGIWADSENPNYSNDENGFLFDKKQRTLVQAPGGMEGSYVVPDGVTNIDNYAFTGCSSLTDITFPDTINNFGNNAFAGCSSLTSIDIPDGVKILRIYSFSGCTSLEHVTIPESVTFIGHYAFADCTSLREITIPDTVTTLEDYIFWGCSNLESVTLPEGIKEIGDCEFGGCTSLTEITIPDSVVTISDHAFYGCTSLTGVVIPANVENIGWDAFKGCTSLEYVLIMWPECSIYQSVDTLGVPGTTTVCGFPGSSADHYAKQYGFDFEPVGFEDVSAESYYFWPVLWAMVYGITNGTDDTHFSPYEPCTRGQTVTFLWRAAGCPEPASSEIPFPDVPANHYYTKAIQWAYENGITDGRPNGTFCPNDTVTRGEFVTFLWRAVGEPAPEDWNPFVDVPDGKFYTDAVLWAAQNGVTTGVDYVHFAPNDPCVRAQVVTFLFRVCA